MIQPTANSDIWAEILRYFRISFSDDTEDEITDKRRTILSVALTCSELADAGLDELWRSMITLEPAARILGDAFIFEARDQYWVSADTAWYELRPSTQALFRASMSSRVKSTFALLGYNRTYSEFATCTSELFQIIESRLCGKPYPLPKKSLSYAQT